ncbi:MoaD/ThiS family protein [Phenylobacterium sp.]|uniref:MoaD/ThiS family protein n=1 Tax=Phenylobacterium sp. TaxID=1871053 RepID=UPI0025F31480|nr:MoaD/ThiS family protein [Phenylobacterium sp.]
MTSDSVDLAEPPRARAGAIARVLFFGRLADLFGRSMSVIIPAEGCAVSDLRIRIAATVEGGAEALGQPGVRVAVDQLMACGDPWVSPGQDVAFLPAFSGG